MYKYGYDKQFEVLMLYVLKISILLLCSYKLHKLDEKWVLNTLESRTRKEQKLQISPLGGQMEK